MREVRCSVKLTGRGRGKCSAVCNEQGGGRGSKVQSEMNREREEEVQCSVKLTGRGRRKYSVV